jgi:hypothetical protein
MPNDAVISLAGGVLCAGIFVFASRHASRPADPLRPRLLPWHTILIISGAACVLAIAHGAAVLAPGLFTAPAPR